MPILADFLTNQFGSNGGGSSGLPIVATELTAGEPIAAGDLIVQAGDGRAYWAADPALPGAKARPLAQTTDIANGLLVPPITVGTASAAGGSQAEGSTATRLAVLPSGNIALTWIADDGVRVATYSPVGALLTGPTLALDGVNPALSARLAITASGAGGFAVTYANATTNGQTLRPRIAFFDAAGAVAGAAVSLETTGGAYSLDLVSLPNNNIVAAWITTAGALKTAIFTPTGTQVGSTQTLMTGITVQGSAGAVDPSKAIVKLAALTGGNFAVVWIASPGTVQNALYAAVYSSANATILSPGTLDSIGYATSSAAGTAFDLTATTDGGFGIAASPSFVNANFNISLQAAKYSATGARIGSVRTLQSFTSASSSEANISLQGVVPIASGAFLVLNVAGAALQAATIGAAGDLGQPLRNVGISGLIVGGARTLQDGSIALIGAASSTVSVARLSLIGGAWTGSALTALTNLAPDSTLVRSSYGLAVLNDAASNAGLTYAVAAFAAGTGPARETLHLINGFVQRRWVAGVAQAGSATGGAVKTQILGPIKTRIPFQQPFAIDQNGANPPGQRMSVVGNQAILKGTQA